MTDKRDTSPQQPLERPYAVYENYEGGLQIIDKQGRIVLDDVYAYDKDREARDARMDALVDALNQSAPSAITGIDEAAKALFFQNAKGWTHKDWAELHEDTKQLWRDEAAKRIAPSGAGAADYKALYHELLLAVGNKWPNETRHQTALRYIQQAERVSDTAVHAEPAAKKVK